MLLSSFPPPPFNPPSLLHSISLPPFHLPTLPLILPPSLSPSYRPSLPLILPPSLPHSLLPTLPLSLTPSLTPSYPPSLAPSYPPSLPLTYPLTLPLTHPPSLLPSQELSGISWTPGSVSLTIRELMLLPNIQFSFRVRDNLINFISDTRLHDYHFNISVHKLVVIFFIYCSFNLEFYLPHITLSCFSVLIF